MRKKERVLKTYIEPEKYLNINTKEMVYVLGFIWADGHVNITNNKGRIILNIVKEDFEYIKNVFDNVGIWSYKEIIPKNRKTQMCIRLYNLNFATFLYEHDYKNKSYVSADKILSKIPDDLKHYFFRGLVDGDGCWYYLKSKRVKLLQITSTYEQNWSYVENLLKSINVKYKIIRLIRKTGNKHSDLRITTLEDIKKIGNYLYNNYENENIGFDRKYDKYIEIITKFTKRNYSKEYLNNFYKLVEKGKRNKEICKILNIKKTICEYLKEKYNKLNK